MNSNAMKLIPGLVAICTIAFAASAAAEPPFAEPADVVITNAPSEPVPTTVENTPQPISASGEWEIAGVINIPPMIAHDMIFFYDQTAGGGATCEFTINYVIDQFDSRTLKRVELQPYESVELHFLAGVDTEQLRFGTVGTVSDPGNCVRNWAVFGFAKP